MSEPSSFTDEIRRIAGELRDRGPSHTALNRASSAIDHLGRRLHGIGYVHGGEIAACFTAALAELDASHTVAEEKRGEAVDRVIHRLDAAADYAAAGVLPAAPA